MDFLALWKALYMYAIVKTYVLSFVLKFFKVDFFSDSVG